MKLLKYTENILKILKIYWKYKLYVSIRMRIYANICIFNFIFFFLFATVIIRFPRHLSYVIVLTYLIKVSSSLCCFQNMIMINNLSIIQYVFYQFDFGNILTLDINQQENKSKLTMTITNYNHSSLYFNFSKNNQCNCILSLS